MDNKRRILLLKTLLNQQMRTKGEKTVDKNGKVCYNKIIEK